MGSSTWASATISSCFLRIPKQSWIWKTKDEGMISTAASIGLLIQWNLDKGLAKLDAYMYAEDDPVKAGAYLALGLVSCGVRGEADPILALLGDEQLISRANSQQKMASIMAIGLAYAGSNNETALKLLRPYVEETSYEIKLAAMAALSLGLICVGTANGEILEAVLTTLMEEERQDDLKDKWTRFMALSVGLLCFGRQEEVDVILETLKVVDHPMSKACQVLAEVCAWAGTGAVLKIQELSSYVQRTYRRERQRQR
jgi:26S proteasome regulatory subunit N1